MNTRFYAVLLADSADEFSIPGAALVERYAFAYGATVTAREVIENNYLFAPGDELLNHYAADVASAACYKNSHPGNANPEP